MNFKLLMACLCALLLFSGSVDARSGGSKGGSHSSHSSTRATGHVNPSSHSVRSYTKKNGTVVKAHRATNPNKTKNDNYSTKGNTNPVTGKKGTKKGDNG